MLRHTRSVRDGWTIRSPVKDTLLSSFTFSSFSILTFPPIRFMGEQITGAGTDCPPRLFI